MQDMELMIAEREWEPPLPRFAADTMVGVCVGFAEELRAQVKQAGGLSAYLLSETHAVGKAKATFFRALSFNETNIPLLEHGLLTLAHSAPVQDVVPSPHGVKYIIEGVLDAPSGASPRIRTVWILETGETNPRFVTAYPA